MLASNSSCFEKLQFFYININLISTKRIFLLTSTTVLVLKYSNSFLHSMLQFFLADNILSCCLVLVAFFLLICLNESWNNFSLEYLIWLALFFLKKSENYCARNLEIATYIKSSKKLWSYKSLDCSGWLPGFSHKSHVEKIDLASLTTSLEPTSRLLAELTGGNFHCVLAEELLITDLMYLILHVHVYEIIISIYFIVFQVSCISAALEFSIRLQHYIYDEMKYVFQAKKCQVHLPDNLMVHLHHATYNTVRVAKASNFIMVRFSL